MIYFRPAKPRHAICPCPALTWPAETGLRGWEWPWQPETTPAFEARLLSTLPPICADKAPASFHFWKPSTCRRRPVDVCANLEQGQDKDVQQNRNLRCLSRWNDATASEQTIMKGAGLISSLANIFSQSNFRYSLKNVNDTICRTFSVDNNWREVGRGTQRPLKE